MAKLKEVKFLPIETTEEMAAIRQALEVQQDIENDMVFDDIPNTVRGVRTLAAMSDEELHNELKERSEVTNDRLDRLLATSDLLKKLD